LIHPREYLNTKIFQCIPKDTPVDTPKIHQYTRNLEAVFWVVELQNVTPLTM
jgi:hypothetical protein